MESEPKLIAITGGPCAGKTSVLEHLSDDEELHGSFLMVPEAATMLLPGFLAVRAETDDRESTWQRRFQTSVTTLQLELEESYKAHATNSDIPLLLCDRGLLDAYVYTQSAEAILASAVGSEKEALDRYYAVVHLESLATSAPQSYSNLGNESRYETLEQARGLEFMTKAAWAGHHNRYAAKGCNLEKKISFVKLLLLQILQDEE